MALTRDQINDFIREQVHPQAESLYKIKTAMLSILDYVEVTGTTAEFIQDTVASTIVSGGRLSTSYNDPAGTVTLTVEPNLSNYTNDIGFLDSTTSISDLADVATLGLTTNQILRWDGSTWSNVTFSASNIVGLNSFISGNSDVVANTAKVSYPGVGAVDHDSLLNYVANEHIDWTIDQGATNINAANIVGLRDATKLQGIDISVTSPNDGDIWVYRSGSSAWVLEAKPAGGSGSSTLADLTDVNLTSVDDNEILAYDTATSRWINQTSGELGLLTTSHSNDSTIHFTQATITTVGTVTSGVWNATAIQDAYISSAATWNAKLSDITSENINDLADVNTVGTVNGHVLTRNTGAWVSQAISITESQISDLQSYLLNITSETIGSLSNVTLSTEQAGQFLEFNGTNWVNSFITKSDISDLGAIATLSEFSSDVTSSRAAVSGDLGQVVVMNSASDLTYTVNTGLGSNNGDEIYVMRAGTGEVNIVAGAGVTINSVKDVSNNIKIAERYSVILLKRQSSNVWLCVGNIFVEMNTMSVRTINTLSHTLDATDLSNSREYQALFLEFNNASAQTLTIPTNATQTFGIGVQINIQQIGVGQLEILPAAGVTFDSVADGLGDYKIDSQNTAVTLVKKGTDRWAIVGNLAT